MPSGRAAGSALLFLLALAAPQPLVGAEARAVEGTDTARILPPSGAVLVPYRNLGYRMERQGDLIVVRVDASPLGSTSPFTLESDAPENDFERLARAVAAGSSTHYEAVSRLLGWVASSIEYELDREKPQDAAAVLERRSGYCTGVARLSVALLDAVGIRAREVAGYVAGGEAANGYHRWIEVYYPGRGWAFSDPLTSHHYVPASYLRLGDRLIDPSGTEGRIVERLDRLTATDIYTYGPPRVRARKNFPVQLAGAVSVHVADGTEGMAVLESPGLYRSVELRGGNGSFVGLEAGEYTLWVRLADGRQLYRWLQIGSRVREMVYVSE